MSDPKLPETALQIQIDEAVAQGLYANMALVNHTDAEFTLDFIYVPAPATQGLGASANYYQPLGT